MISSGPLLPRTRYNKYIRSRRRPTGHPDPETQQSCAATRKAQTQNVRTRVCKESHRTGKKQTKYVPELCLWMGSRCPVGLRRLLRRVIFIYTPYRWEQGAKKYHSRVGLGGSGRNAVAHQQPSFLFFLPLRLHIYFIAGACT